MGVGNQRGLAMGAAQLQRTRQESSAWAELLSKGGSLFRSPSLRGELGTIFPAKVQRGFNLVRRSTHCTSYQSFDHRNTEMFDVVLDEYSFDEATSSFPAALSDCQCSSALDDVS